MTSKCKCHLYILPFIVLSIIVFSYFIYVISICIFIVHNVLESTLYIIFFNILFILLLWSFLSTVFTPLATVPLIYKLTEEELELFDRSDVVNKNLILDRICLEKNLTVQTRYPASYIR